MIYQNTNDNDVLFFYQNTKFYQASLARLQESSVACSCQGRKSKNGLQELSADEEDRGEEHFANFWGHLEKLPVLQTFFRRKRV